MKNRCAGRAEFSKRQDWACEASWKFFNLVQPINLYCIQTLILDPNILRDSTLTRIEQIRFQAYIHTNAILWKICFQELRALTNTKQMNVVGLGVNPVKTKQRAREPPGIAVTSPQILKLAVTKVCGVRKRRTGSVTIIMREANANVIELADTRRKAKHKADMEQKARTHLNKGIQHNINMTEELVNSETDLEAHLEMLGHAVGASLTFLKRQFNARMARAEGNSFHYPGIGQQYRTKNGKDLKMTPLNNEVTSPYYTNSITSPNPNTITLFV